MSRFAGFVSVPWSRFVEGGKAERTRVVIQDRMSGRRHGGVRCIEPSVGTGVRAGEVTIRNAKIFGKCQSIDHYCGVM